MFPFLFFLGAADFGLTGLAGCQNAVERFEARAVSAVTSFRSDLILALANILMTIDRLFNTNQARSSGCAGDFEVDGAESAANTFPREQARAVNGDATAGGTMFDKNFASRNDKSRAVLRLLR